MTSTASLGEVVTNGVCKLCLRAGLALRGSHVIPSFVFRWMRQSSIGFMRDGNNADVRVQDGPKYPWLCDECEHRLSAWEKPFAEQVFSYVHGTSADQKPVAYGPWALKFAASVSWRALLFAREQPAWGITGENAALGERAQERWRRFLLDGEEHPGPFEQHVLFLDAPAKVTGPASPFLSRYLTRAVALDLLTSKSTCLTYAKLCRVVVFGFVREPLAKKWRGTKLHVRKGLMGGTAHVPAGILHYFNAKADDAGASAAKMSPRQKAKVDEVFRKTPLDRLAASEAFRAVRADVALSGREAFASTGRLRGVNAPFEPDDGRGET